MPSHEIEKENALKNVKEKSHQNNKKWWHFGRRNVK